ncbi:MAG: site-specific integrase [Magnetococcales bacterium]|nr:tyrosine-type recombinase/integrase [Magnetococcales bacterium]NGZ06786.1 site-specific integrase [Magnetococcales bacterium]
MSSSRVTSGVGEPITEESSLDAALSGYVEQVSARKSPLTQAREQRKARQISARLGTMPLGEVTPLDLCGYRDQRMREANAAIVQGDLDLLRDLFDWLLESGVSLAGNPSHGVAAPRDVVERSRRLSPGEQVRLFAACERRPSPMLGWIVRIALQTAMHKDEILNIRKQDVNLKARIVTIVRTPTRPGRQVPLTREAERWFAKAWHHPDRPADEELLFYGALGTTGIRRPLAIDKSFRSVVQQARLKGLRFADLREEALARMRDAGLTEIELQVLAGLPVPRGGPRSPRPAVEMLVARLDEVGLGGK